VPRLREAEYLPEFRTDLEGFVALEVVEACVGDYREQQPAVLAFARRYARARCEEERIGVRMGLRYARALGVEEGC
jgi:hypothetical protein